MKKITSLLVAVWGVVSLGIHAQSSLPRIMLEVTEELNREHEVSAVLTLEQADETGAPTKKETYTCRLKYGGESSASYSTPDGLSRLEAEDDAATNMLGDGWRMPTRDELTELAEKCEWQWVANADSTGYRVTGPNGNSIFLPTTGICSGRRHLLAGAEGYYWSSDAITYLLDVAFALHFTPRIINHDNYKETPRSNGCAVRAVKE